MIVNNKIGVLILVFVMLLSGVVIFVVAKNGVIEAPSIENISTITDTTTSTTTDVVASSTATSTAPDFVNVPKVVTAIAPVLNTGHAIGIAGGGVLSKTNTKDLNAQLDKMVEAGITWVRFDIEWGLVQYGGPEKSEWSSYDALVKAINAHHLKSLGILLFTPEWARAQGCGGGAKCPPKDPQQFAKFAAEAVARYSSQGVRAWEVWNEPNSYDFWATKTNCTAYTELLKATYVVIKKVDPGATVVTGGVAPLSTDKNNISRRDFLTCIYKNGGKGYFDAVGDHPYTFPNLPSADINNAWGQMSLSSPSLRSIMIENGDSAKKIWITEVGAPTGGPDSYWFVSEEKQASIVADMMKVYKTYDWAGPLFFYTIKDNGTEPNTNENFFGLLRFDGSAKPAYDVLKRSISSGL